VIQVDKAKKRALLSMLIKDNDWHQVLVFTRTKHGAKPPGRTAEQGRRHLVAIHGNKSQGARTRALAEFKEGSLRVLVATDIAARGLDIEDLPHVVNFEIPNVAEDYVHRIGRTGRAGASGEAISLVCVDELKFLADIERLLKRELPRQHIPGFEPDLTVKPVPIPMGPAHAGSNTTTDWANRRNRARGTRRRAWPAAEAAGCATRPGTGPAAAARPPAPATGVRSPSSGAAQPSRAVGTPGPAKQPTSQPHTARVAFAGRCARVEGADPGR